MKTGVDERGAPSGPVLARLYALCATPVVLLLCFLIQPVHGIDEPNHFLRVSQLASGSVMPVLGPDERSTGSIAAQGTRDLATFYGRVYLEYRMNKPLTFAELGRLYAIHEREPKAYISHSNTTVYSPLAYVAQVSAFKAAQAVTDRPLVWMYAGRVTTALLGVLLSFLALRHARQGRYLFFLVAALPITLFQSAALSADSVLIPATLCLCVILTRVLDREPLGVGTCVLATLLAAFIGLGKIAYMPIALMPPVIALLVTRRFDRTVIALGIGAVAILALWALWSARVNNLVFTVRQISPEHIDVHKQLALVIARPMVFVHALGASMNRGALDDLGSSFAGALIGWNNIRLPRAVLYVNYLLLAAALVVDWRPRPAPPLVRALVYLVAVVCTLAIYLMLYLQWNDVGGSVIYGVQGRYLLPLAPLLGIVTPALVVRGRALRAWVYALLGWCGLLALLTPVYVLHRYWGVI